MFDKIVLLDPSIREDGKNSKNLGDLIIYDSVIQVLEKIFPEKAELIRISTHIPFSKKSIDIIKKSKYVFVGGTNLLSGNIKNFDRMIPEKTRHLYRFPKNNGLILLGVGWNKYDAKTTFLTANYYHRILNKTYAHSLRDEYSLQRLSDINIKNTLYTSCPTTWNIKPDLDFNYNQNKKSILFTITDWLPDETNDSKLINIILEQGFEDIYFFPQGSNDLEYLFSLSIWKKNRERIKLLDHNYKEFKNLINLNNFNYIGTRLHCGIKCLSHGIPSLILSIDNRAHEMSKNSNLPVASRDDFPLINSWLQGSKVFDQKISLPLKDINFWTNQFRG